MFYGVGCFDPVAFARPREPLVTRLGSGSRENLERRAKKKRFSLSVGGTCTVPGTGSGIVPVVLSLRETERAQLERSGRAAPKLSSLRSDRIAGWRAT